MTRNEATKRSSLPVTLFCLRRKASVRVAVYPGVGWTE